MFLRVTDNWETLLWVVGEHLKKKGSVDREDEYFSQGYKVQAWKAEESRFPRAAESAS